MATLESAIGQALKQADAQARTLFDIDVRARREGWGGVGAQIANAAVDLLAHLARGRDAVAGSDPLRWRRAGDAISEAGSALRSLRAHIGRAIRLAHLRADEAERLCHALHDLDSMLVAIGILVRAGVSQLRPATAMRT